MGHLSWLKALIWSQLLAAPEGIWTGDTTKAIEVLSSAHLLLALSNRRQLQIVREIVLILLYVKLARLLLWSDLILKVLVY